MRRVTRSGREYGADADGFPETNIPSGDGRRDCFSDEAATKVPVTTKRRPLLRGWIHLAAVPYTILLAHRLTLRAPNPAAAYAAIFACYCAALQQAVSAYYHAVTHTPSRRSQVRKYDHACIFITIAGTYTPFVHYAYQQSGNGAMWYLLVAEWLLALSGILVSILGLSRHMNKLHRVLMYVLVGWLPAPVFVMVYGWDVFLWNGLGGLVYVLGGLAYGIQWPDIVPGVFGHHELFHIATVVANTFMMMGLEQAFLNY